MNQEKEEERLVGLVERIMFKNEDTGYHVLSVGVEDLMEEVKVTINQPNIFEGLTYEFKGEYIVHPRFGNQFKANIAFEVLPSTKEGLKAYLSSSFFPGIGPVIAGKIIDYFGDKVMDVFNNNIDKLIEIPGISKRKLEAIKSCWEENKEINDVMVFLQQNGISTLYASKIYKFYGKKCVAKIMENPYLLAKDIAGIGFKYADKVALNLGFAKNGFERIKACVHYVLEQGTIDGHCFLTKNQIISKSSDYIGLEVKSIVEDALVQLERIDDIKVINESGEKRYYSKKLYYNEIYCAEKINALKETNQKVKINDSWLDIPDDPIKLSPEQKEAVINILGKGISVLTGGPGSGKCLKKGTLVLMYDGSKKKVEDIVVGDFLMGDDSTPRKVLSLARGKEKMYDIISNDKKEWGCNESHILSLVYIRNNRPLNINGSRYEYGDVVNISVKDYLKLSNKTKHYLKQRSTGVEYVEKSVIIPPYLLGLWLGDGGSKAPCITNTDEEIFVYGEQVAKELNLTYRKRVHKNRTQDFRLTGIRNKSFSSLLRKYNLWDNKHIPDDYKINSRAKRLELLAGLIDTDGSLYGSGNFEITSSKKTLAFDIYELSMSLGFRTSIREKNATMKRKDGSIYRSIVYRITIGGFIDKIPTKIKRKQAKNTPNKNPMHSGFKVIDKGEGEYYGFELDGNKLFVLGNYVITHNTTTTKKIVRVLLDLGKSLVLAAPTGRAAQRMTEVIGFQASTIHRLLGWDHENKSFLKNENNPIQAEFIIIDESSMIDINLAASLLRAIPHDCQVLFIGDADQLPPVGPGDFFSDLISSGSVPVFKLKKIFRQGEESLIIKYAHEINSGKTPNIDSPLLTPSLWKNKVDCTFIDSGIKDANHNNADYPKWSSLRYNMGLLEMITNLYTESIPKYFGEDKEVQILIPMNIGDLGCIKVNEVIQLKVNPPSKEKSEIKIKDKIFRCGDKVIQKANNYDLNVFNGDIGRITEVDSDKTEMSVLFSEDREVLYRKSDILELDLAYAISIHKSQGSEFDCIIIPVMMQYSRMLQRNLIYTGLTRAKKLAIFVGQRKSFEIAVKNDKYQKRQTNLKEFLKKESIFNSFI